MQTKTYLSNDMTTTIRKALNTLDVDVGDTVSLETMTQALGVPEGLLRKQCLIAIEDIGLVKVNRSDTPETYTISTAWTVLRDAPTIPTSATP